VSLSTVFDGKTARTEHGIWGFFVCSHRRTCTRKFILACGAGSNGAPTRAFVHPRWWATRVGTRFGGCRMRNRA